MDSQQIIEALRGAAPDGAIETAASADGMPTIYVAREHIAEVCLALRDRPELRFAFVPDITAVDYLPRDPRYEVVIHLASFGLPGFGDTAKRLRIKVKVPADDARMPTISGVWPAMNWGEREVYDMFGIAFDGHPDLRRILMPDDWEGHPGRKDYPVQIKMTPKVYEPLQLTPQQFAESLQSSRGRADQD